MNDDGKTAIARNVLAIAQRVIDNHKAGRIVGDDRLEWAHEVKATAFAEKFRIPLAAAKTILKRKAA